MRLVDFSIRNFKNLHDVRLESLGAINIIHGPNNVGKSNALQAMAVFFRCLRPRQDELPFVHTRAILASDIEGLHVEPLELFNLDSPADIVLSGKISVSTPELKLAGISEIYPCDPVDIEVVLSRSEGNAMLKITRFRFSNGTDATQAQKSPEEKARCMRFALFLTANMLVRHGPTSRFAIIGVERQVEKDALVREDDSAPLALEMYDSRESLDALRVNRWKAFVQAMKGFEDITGKGEFIATFQRSEGKARLVFDNDKTRVPLALLGSGVQQLVSLLGNLLMCNASIVAIEEPELNLRWDVQERLRQVLSDLVSQPEGADGPSQLFLSSHSPAFEGEEAFYLMEPGPAGPTISRRPAKEIGLVLQAQPAPAGLPSDAPQAYVTSQGVVKIPEHIRKLLKLSQGGGVVFLPEQGGEGARLLSEEAYFHLVGDEG